MSKKSKPPADPIDSAFAMIERIHDRRPAHPGSEQMVQTALIVRAIDRLTAAVKANTEVLLNR
jgi:hypothetical protein